MMRGIVLALAASLASAWPNMYRDCSVFPSLGEPQKRPHNHPPMALLCLPTPGGGATFAECASSCSVQESAKQNCSTALCTCTEHCMGSEDVCTTNTPSPDPTHHSLPDAFNLRAVAGSTALLLDGRPIRAGSAYSAGTTHRLTIVPGASNATTLAPPSWFLIDAGVGAFSVLTAAAAPIHWDVACDGSRASFMSPPGVAVDVLWAAPSGDSGGGDGAVTLRVAEATSMGNITVAAAVLNASSSGLAPPGELGYSCTVTEGLRPGGGAPTRQCMSVPLGTVGALTKAACEADCFRGAGGTYAYRCLRCDHVYSLSDDPQGRAFEDLPDDWVCPTCGAPKSAYAKQLSNSSEGKAVWAHSHV
jgi:rubredoxin